MSDVRVRFSPAPTGYLHVGSARTALFNWLFARHHGGQLLVRIEDTDAERSRPELVDAILEALRWLGLDWDGEPVHQSDWADDHRKAALELLDRGAAYWCDCAPEEVQARAKARGGPPGYDGHCRGRGLVRSDETVLRVRVPDEGTTSFTDVVRGEISVENATIEDFVVLRRDGSPMFVVANALDDPRMGITHVIRGEDLINVTPRAILIRRALDIDFDPVFAHLPMLVNEQRKKLSKRRDDVSVADYRDQGYLPDAMANYLSLLGWGPPDGVEVRPIEEIIELFALEDVGKAAAFFDVQKLRHVNSEHIRRLTVDEFIGAAGRFLERGPWLPGDFDFETFEAMAPLVQERAHVLTDVPEMVDFLFLAEAPTDQAEWDAMVAKTPAAAAILDEAVAAYEGCDWSAGALHDALLAIGEAHGLKLGKAQAPVRLAVTGKRVGPPLFESLEVLGRERTLERLRAARSRLE